MAVLSSKGALSGSRAFDAMEAVVKPHPGAGAVESLDVV
jgi:hypothetical protein